MSASSRELKVCYVFQDEYPWDVRVEKIVTSLAQAGMDAHIVCRNRTGIAKTETVSERITIHRLSRGFDSVTRSLANFPAFFSPFWINRLESVVKQVRADVIIIRDLPLSPAAWYVGRRTGIPVVMDMAENYPAMIQDTWTFRGPGPLDHVIRNPRLLRRLERWVIPRLDGVLVVSEASKRRVAELSDGHTPLYVVSNTPRREPGLSTAGSPDSSASELIAAMKASSRLKLLYVGGMEETRGLDVVVRALVHITRSIHEFEFIAVGRGTSEQYLRDLANELGVADHLKLPGWVAPENVPRVVAASDLCIVPHYVTEHTDTTVPNKIFDYMMHRKPVLVSHARALRDIVERTGCGVHYQDDDHEALARAVIELQPEQRRAELGEAGRRAVEEHYNWSVDERILIDAIIQVAGEVKL